MRARTGEMRHRVTIQTPVATPDGQGGSTIVWTDVATVWAFVRPEPGKEVVENMRTQTNCTHRVFLRHTTGVTTARRLKYGTRIFDILSAVNSREEGVQMELVCREVL